MKIVFPLILASIAIVFSLTLALAGMMVKDLDASCVKTFNTRYIERTRVSLLTKVPRRYTDTVAETEWICRSGSVWR